MSSSTPLDRLAVGMRAVVRHRIAGGLTDSLGQVVALDSESVSIQTRRGVDIIARAAVVAAKEVPPAPSRRGAAHLAISMADLQRVMVDGWPPIEREHLGQWLLRAGDGHTGRANSVLALGDPGRPLAEAVTMAERWYDARGLRRLFSLYGPEGFAVPDDPLGAELENRGYHELNRSLVITASVERLAALADVDGRWRDEVRLDETPSDAWWTIYTAGRPGDRGAMEAILTGSPEQLFASIAEGEAAVGAARVAFAHAWSSVSAVNVLPSHRRRGLATRLMAGCAQASRARGIRSMYLQVGQDNTAALALYRGLGFVRHHEYVYLASVPGCCPRTTESRLQRTGNGGSRATSAAACQPAEGWVQVTWSSGM